MSEIGKTRKGRWLQKIVICILRVYLWTVIWVTVLTPVSRTAKGKLKWPLFARPMSRLNKISMTSLMIFFQKFLLAPPDRCSLVDLLKDALQEVLFQRPENPIEFLKEYFAQLKNN